MLGRDTEENKKTPERPSRTEYEEKKQFVVTLYLSLSYSDSVVILERWGDFYTVQFDSANISAMTLSLHKLERSSIIVGPDSLALDICRNCVHNKISSYHPYSSYPLPGVYVKSYGYGKGLIWVHYNRRELVGVKLTGLCYSIQGVPNKKGEVGSWPISKP